MVPEFDWPQIDTVLLDMDGTLLDLGSTATFGSAWCRRR